MSADKKVKISVFKKNSLGYLGVLLSIFFELYFSVKILDSIPVGAMMGVSCFINIVLLFLLFSVAVKVNLYRRFWAVIGLAVGGYAILRAFVLLPVVLRPTENMSKLFLSTLVEGILLVLSCLESYIVSSRRSTFLDSEEGQALTKEVR